MLNIAVVDPIPCASVAMIANANPGFRRKFCRIGGIRAGCPSVGIKQLDRHRLAL
jgi:hypothetical protein